jgi:RNA polymerase sigma-70 factor, ECF subfamily
VFWSVMDDLELARRLASDLDDAFEPLVRAHVDRLYSIALGLTGDRRDAEEIAQDALVRAYRALERYEPERIRELALRPWLATIVINAARNRRRAAADRQPPIALDEPAAGMLRAPGHAQPEAVAIRRDAGTRLETLVRTLPDRYRAPIVLRYVDDLPYSDIAQVLRRPEGTLKAQVHRGLALLRAAYEAAEREEMTA